MHTPNKKQKLRYSWNSTIFVIFWLFAHTQTHSYIILRKVSRTRMDYNGFCGNKILKPVMNAGLKKQPSKSFAEESDNRVASRRRSGQTNGASVVTGLSSALFINNSNCQSCCRTGLDLKKSSHPRKPNLAAPLAYSTPLSGVGRKVPIVSKSLQKKMIKKSIPEEEYCSSFTNYVFLAAIYAIWTFTIFMFP